MDGHSLKSEKTSIIKSGFFSILSVIAASVCYLGVYFFIVFALGKEQLGIWSTITSIPAVIAFFGSGVSGSLVRHIPMHFMKQEMTGINKLISNGILFNLILALAIITPAGIYSVKILKFLFGINTVPHFYFQIYYITLAVFVVNFITSVTLAALDGLQLIPLKNKLLIGGTFLFSLTAVVFIHFFRLTGLLYAQLFQALIVFCLSLLALRRTNGVMPLVWNIDFKVMRLFYTYGSHLQYISILSMLFDPVTRFFLNRYFGLGTVGTYDIVNRIITQLRMLIVSAVQVILPFVAKQGEESDLDSMYNKIFRGTLIISSILFGLLLTSAFSFIYLFKKFETEEFQILILYLLFSNLVNVLASPAYFIMLGLGRLKIVIVSHFISTTLNICLFLALGNDIKSSIMGLPTFLAISLSSIYVLINFKAKYLKKSESFKIEDFSIYCVSVLFPIFSIIISFYYFNRMLLIAILIIHGLTLLYLCLRNEFVKEVVDILLKRDKINI